MEDLAVERVRHGGEVDVWVRPNVDAVSGILGDRAHVIEEDERAYHLVRERRQEPPDFEAADVPHVGFEYHAAAVAGGCTGRVTVNLVPTPTCEVTSIFPPWFAMIL